MIASIASVAIDAPRKGRKQHSVLSTHVCLRCDNRQDSPKCVPADLHDPTFQDGRVIRADEPRHLEEWTVRQDGCHFRFAIMGHRQRMALPSFPLPEGRPQTEAEVAAGYIMVPVNQVPLVTQESLPLQDEGENEMVAPPEQRTKGKLILVEEVFGKVEILVREILQMFPFDELES